MRLLHTLLTLLASLSVATAQDFENYQASARHLDVRRWTVREGLLQQTLTDVLETRDGYLWMTTFGGLARFDGLRFKDFTLDDTPELGTNRLESLFEDSAGRLWIGTISKGIVRHDAGDFHAYRDGVPGGGVRAIVEDGSGGLWAAGAGLARFDGVRWSLVAEPAWLATTQVDDLRVDREGRVWAASARGLLRCGDAGVEVVDDGPLACAARSLTFDRAGKVLWVASEVGLGRLAGDRVEEVLPLTGPIHCSAVDDDGRVLLGVGTGCLVLEFDEAGVARLEPLVLPGFEDVMRGGAAALHTDRQGSLWIGTNTFGLLRVARAPFAQFENEQGLLFGSTSLLADDRRGGVWVQSSTGWLVHGAGGVFETPRATPGWEVPARGTDLLGTTRAGVLWLRERDDYTYSVEGSLEGGFETRRYHVHVGRGLVEDDDGVLWFGGAGCLFSFVEERFERHELPGVTGEVTVQLLARDGALWFRADDLVGRRSFEDGAWRVEVLRQGDALPEGELRGFHESAPGVLWVTTYGSGLLRIAGGEVLQFGRESGITELALGGILEDDERRLWINSNRGILLVSLDGLEAYAAGSLEQVECHFLGSPETNGPGGARDGHGRMWFPTVSGLVVADPADYEPRDVPPILHVESTVADGEPCSTDAGIRIPAGTQSFSIHYVGLSLRDPEQLRFEYRLAGYHDDWVDAEDRRAAVFTKVPPGSYEFHLRAASADGARSELGPTPVHVAARLHELTAVRVGAVLLLLGLVWCAHRLRVAGIARHAAELREEIEQREHAEREREVLQERLRESSRLEAVGRLAGGIAHDFNNVLTAILGRAELLSLEPEVDAAERRDHIESITECGERAAALTRQLLAFGRKQVLVPRVLPVNGAIERLRPMLEHLLPENIVLDCRLGSELPSICVDPSQLEQVVMNLVLNARDAMPDGGRVLLETYRASLDSDYVRSYPEAVAGEHVVLTVRDFGEGMGTDVLPFVFEPFFTTKSERHGTGLGLASVHGIVLQSGGHIRVESKPGVGSTFWVYFPIAPRPPARAPDAPGARAAPVAGRERLLICEDDEPTRAMMERALRHHGYTVSVSAHPDEALELAARSPFDMLITDVVLPGMDGRQLAARLPALAVVFVTGYTDDVLSEADARGGRVTVLRKPFTPTRLLSRVREHFDGLVGSVPKE